MGKVDGGGPRCEDELPTLRVFRSVLRWELRHMERIGVSGVPGIPPGVAKGMRRGAPSSVAVLWRWHGPGLSQNTEAGSPCGGSERLALGLCIPKQFGLLNRRHNSHTH